VLCQVLLGATRIEGPNEPKTTGMWLKRKRSLELKEEGSCKFSHLECSRKTWKVNIKMDYRYTVIPRLTTDPAKEFFG